MNSRLLSPNSLTNAWLHSDNECVLFFPDEIFWIFLLHLIIDFYHNISFFQCHVPLGHRWSQLSKDSLSFLSANWYEFLKKIVEWIPFPFCTFWNSVCLFLNHPSLKIPVYPDINSRVDQGRREEAASCFSQVYLSKSECNRPAWHLNTSL